MKHLQLGVFTKRKMGSKFLIECLNKFGTQFHTVKLIVLKPLQLKMKVKMLVYKIMFQIMYTPHPLLLLYVIIATMTPKQSVEKLCTALMGSSYKEHQNKKIISQYVAQNPCKNNDCNWTRTQNHLVHKRTLNHLAKLAKWLSCVLSTYLSGAFDCMFLSCRVPVSEWIHTL